LGIRQSDSSSSTRVKLEHLDNTINSADNEIAPVPFGDDILYFTKLSTSNAEILRSQFIGGKDWSAAQPLKVLNIPDKMPFGNGTFSPDGNHFFCTMCQTTETRSVKKLTCGINVLNRQTEGWSAPLRLSERVNTEGGVTTQPYVFQKANREFLLFVSDRPSGRGGMDIWLTSRLRGDDRAEFEPAINLGSVVNTEGDELTPYYDATDGLLYFASNGRPTMGGLDIFKSQGWLTQWTSPENMGAPFNSGADDWYFIKNPSRTGGFLVSNRSYGMEKIGTRDDDMFQFTLDDRIILSLNGRIFDKNKQILIENARISLYEQKGNAIDDLKLLSSVVSEKGNFDLSVLPHKNYVIEVEKEGFKLFTKMISTRDSAQSARFDCWLDNYAPVVNQVLTGSDAGTNPPDVKNTEGGKKATKPTKNEKPKAEKTDKTDKILAEKTDKIEKTTKVENPNKSEKIETANREKIEFKVQIMAYATEKPEHSNLMRLKRVDNLGEVETETAVVNGTRFTRVLMAFDTYEAAQKALKIIKEKSLSDAFVVRYENGKRTNKSK
jgi:hypothetical protein